MSGIYRVTLLVSERRVYEIAADSDDDAQEKALELVDARGQSPTLDADFYSEQIEVLKEGVQDVRDITDETRDPDAENDERRAEATLAKGAMQ